MQRQGHSLLPLSGQAGVSCSCGDRCVRLSFGGSFFVDEKKPREVGPDGAGVRRWLQIELQ